MIYTYIYSSNTLFNNSETEKFIIKAVLTQFIIVTIINNKYYCN